jgi:hypothetical protein
MELPETGKNHLDLTFCLRQSIESSLKAPTPLILFSLALLFGCSSVSASSKPRPSPSHESGSGWHALFDGKTLSGWKKIDFGGQGDVRAEDGKLILSRGEPMTGAAWTGEHPKIDYEIELEAMRVEGSDFFCGLTFPVRDSSATLILGGWGGELCGISSFDGMDASENETSTARKFEQGNWYRVRLRVTQERIEAWLGDEKLIDADTAGRKIDVRREVLLCKPLGLSTYRTTGAVRGLKWKPVEPPPP